MKMVKSVGSQSDYVKNRNKILKLIKQVAGTIKLPPEYDGMINWDTLEKDVKLKLPQYKDKLEPTIKRCVEILMTTGQDGGYGVRQIMDTMDVIGDMMQINKFELGLFEGFVRGELEGNEWFRDNLPLIIMEIVKILSE